MTMIRLNSLVKVNNSVSYTSQGSGDLNHPKGEFITNKYDEILEYSIEYAHYFTLDHILKIVMSHD